MRQKVDFQDREALHSRRDEFDFSKKMSEIHVLREQVRLAEMAAMERLIVARKPTADTHAN